jgi:DNA-directed RNA polymerase subunit alpha
VLEIVRPSVDLLEGDENRQKFVIGPLERGFGHTIGNSLRRTLLSSVPGAAITQVRFDNALHEYSVLPGVKEDTMEIILNLKDVIVRCWADHPVSLRLDVPGPKEVVAGDIQVPADVEIINPDLYIATVDEGGRLAADLTVERGKGFVSAEARPRPPTIGVIPIDAIFSPVRRVAVEVQQEQATNYERLILDVETDGSLAPREALASAAETLRNVMALIADLSEKPQGLSLGDIVVESVASPDLELSIDELGLSERARNCLKRAQIFTIGDLVSRTVEDLLAITNFGQKSLNEVIEKLDERGLSLRGSARV